MKYLTILLILILSFANNAEAKRKKYSSLVMNIDNGEILHSRSDKSWRYPASLTKVMTLYVVFDYIKRGKLKMNQKIRVSRKASRQPAMKMWLKHGSYITVKEAIMSLIIKSANDSAVVLAEAVAGSERKFAKLMTKTARKLGMTKTTFRNASGLHHPRQKTTARDMVKLTKALIKNHSKHYPLFKRTSFYFKGKKYHSHNRVLKKLRGAEGLKTGYISASGFNLITTAKRKNGRLVGVIFGAKSATYRNQNMRYLMNSAFSRDMKKKKKLAKLVINNHQFKPSNNGIVVDNNKSDNNVIKVSDKVNNDVINVSDKVNNDFIDFDQVVQVVLNMNSNKKAVNKNSNNNKGVDNIKIIYKPTNKKKVSSNGHIMPIFKSSFLDY